MPQDIKAEEAINPCPLLSDEVQAWENKIKALVEGFCQGIKEPQCCVYKLKESTFRLHSELNIRQRYLDTLEKAHHFVPGSSRKWGWFDLIDTPSLRVGLISLHRFFRIPVHDHPNTFCIQKIISGKVRVRQYQFAANSNQDHSLVSLEKVFDRVLIKGESSYFTPSLRNLHELESISSQTVILSLMANPYKPHERSWYFPLPMTQTGNISLYNRIRKDIMLPKKLKSEAR